MHTDNLRLYALPHHGWRYLVGFAIILLGAAHMMADLAS